MRRNIHADRISQRFWGRTSAKNCGTAPTPFTGHPKALRPLKSTPYSPPYHLSPQLRPSNPLSISAAATFTHRPTTLQGHATTLLRRSQVGASQHPLRSLNIRKRNLLTSCLLCSLQAITFLRQADDAWETRPYLYSDEAAGEESKAEGEKDRKSTEAKKDKQTNKEKGRSSKPKKEERAKSPDD